MWYPITLGALLAAFCDAWLCKNNEIQNKFTFDLSNAVTDLSIGNGNGNVEYTGQGFA